MKTEKELCFGPYRIAPDWGQLWQEQQEVKLTPKALAVLRVLVLRAGHVVTKEEFFQAVWPDTVVSDDALTTCILELRQALRDNAKHPRFIETVHRRGYRFLAAVTPTPPSVERSQLQVHSAPSPASPHTTLHLKPETLLVGRDTELAHLHQLLLTALNGERQIVFVTGEAGIGKTALVEAFLASVDSRCQAHDAPPWIAHGQCIEHYGPGEPYLPILAALGRLCRAPEGTQLVTFLRQHAPTWLVHMPAVLEDTEVEALQRKTAGATRERMLRELAEAVEVLTADRPLILWIEDLQWCDPSTLDWLSFLARRRERAKLLVLGSFRPIDTIVHDHPLRLVKQDLLVHRQCEELPLGLLSEAAVAEYLSVRFSVGETRRSSLHHVVRLVHRRTDGNPLFMVAMVDALVTQGVITSGDEDWTLRDDRALGATTIPASLRQMVEHQVEQLTVEGRHVLEAASVAGREFSTAEVAAGLASDTAEEQCAALVRSGLFLPTDDVIEWPDGTVVARYTFLHALYQEVVYARLPAGRRQELHRRIGERKEAAHGEHAGAIAAELAMHFERARDFHKAVRYVVQSGEAAIQRNAYPEAVRQLSQGLTLLVHWPDTPPRAEQELRLLLTLGPAVMALKGYGTPDVEQVYAKAATVCHQLGDTPQRLLPVLGGLWTLYQVRANFSRARALAERSLTVAEHLPTPTARVYSRLWLGQTAFCRGELCASRAHFTHSLSLYDPHRDSPRAVTAPQDPGESSLAYLSWALWLLGYPQQALATSQRAKTLSETLTHPHSLAHALHFAAWLAYVRSEPQLVQEYTQAARHALGEDGSPYRRAQGLILSGRARVELGQREQGITQIQQGIAAWTATGAKALLPMYLALLAEAYYRVGQSGAGLETVCVALEHVAATEERWYEAELYRLKGELLLQSQDQTRRPEKDDQQTKVSPALRQKGNRQNATISNSGLLPPDSQAEACFCQALDIARIQQAKSWELRAATSLARVRHQQGKRTEAHTLLSHIYTWFTEGLETRDLQEAKLLLDELAADSPVSRA